MRRSHGFLLGREERERLQRRDPTALDAFFESHFDSVYSLVFRLTGRHHAAEDVTQEIFFRVYRSIDRLDVAREMEPWLTAIVYNTCRSYWRKLGPAVREAVSIDGNERLQANPSGEDLEDEVVRKEQERIVQAAILQLPDPLRVTIVMHDYWGLTHEEIARATSVSHAATRKRYSRAIAQLSKLLKGALSR